MLDLSATLPSHKLEPGRPSFHGFESPPSKRDRAGRTIWSRSLFDVRSVSWLAIFVIGTPCGTKGSQDLFPTSGHAGSGYLNRPLAAFKRGLMGREGRYGGHGVISRDSGISSQG
jgi:hypothetical protein